MGFKSYYKMLKEDPEDYTQVPSPKFIKLSDLFYLITDKQYSSVSITGSNTKTGKSDSIVTYVPKLPESLKTIDTLLISKFYNMLLKAKETYNTIEIKVTSKSGTPSFYKLGANLKEEMEMIT